MRIFYLLYIGLIASSCSPKEPFEDVYATSSKFNRLVWADEFDQNTLDTTRWKSIIGDGCPDLCGFGNNELQYYTSNAENLKINNGILTIVARKNAIGSSSYSSAKLVSKGKGDWQYGRIEVSAKIPSGRGTWPAIWMLPTMERSIKWPQDGEIDIMEHVGYNPGVVYGATHTENFNGINGTQKVDSLIVETASDEFHVYALEWEEDRLAWYIDQNKFFELDKDDLSESDWAFNQEFHLIMNLAVGGNWGGKYGVDSEAFPQELAIDYVRVYQ